VGTLSRAKKNSQQQYKQLSVDSCQLADGSKKYRVQGTKNIKTGGREHKTERQL